MQRQMESRKVRDVMTARPFTVSPETRLMDLRRLFDTHDYNTFPVVDASGVLVGIVTKLDLLRVFGPDPRRRLPDAIELSGLAVGDVMHPGVMTLEPDHPLAVAVDLMLESRLHSLPVVERRRGGAPLLVGILSRGDVLKSLMSALPRTGTPHQRARRPATEGAGRR